MFRSTLLAATGLFFAAGSMATAGSCMNDEAANKVASNFGLLISNYSVAFANSVLCTDYKDYTDSVIELIDSGCPNGAIPLGSVTFDGRAAFEVGQGGQPDIPFILMNVWHNCDTVTLRWKTPAPGIPSVTPQEQVTGIIVLETVYAGATAPEPFLIETSYSEFNSGAWLYDLGVFVPTCSNSTSKAKRSDVKLPGRMM